jgi:DNA-binding CsgD family transcriptional regulator
MHSAGRPRVDDRRSSSRAAGPTSAREATGARVPPRSGSGLDALTPSESRIARMAADGATNKEIAQALFLSVKTIEMHLSHAYRKLDIGSRRELSATMPTDA